MSDDPNIWTRILSSRSPEAWVAIIAGALYVWRKGEEQPRAARTVECSISALIGYALGPDAAAWSGAPEVISFLLVTTLGYLALDLAVALLRDRELLRSIVARRLGGRDE